MRLHACLMRLYRAYWFQCNVQVIENLLLASFENRFGHALLPSKQAVAILDKAQSPESPDHTSTPPLSVSF